MAKIEGLGGVVIDIAILPKMQRHAETKTADPKVRRSLVTDALGIGLTDWSEREDSNLRPLAPEASALPG